MEATQLQGAADVIRDLRAASANSSIEEKAAVNSLIDDFESWLVEVSEEPATPGRESAAIQSKLRKLIRNVADTREFYSATAGLFTDLRVAGFSFTSLSDFSRDGVGTADAVPIFMKWLSQTTAPLVRMRLLSVLHNSWAKPSAIGPLMEELRRVRSTGLAEEHGGCWDIVLAISNLVDSSDFEIFVQIASDPANGSGRAIAIWSLKPMRKHRAEVTRLLLQFLKSDDSQVIRPAADTVASWGVIEAIPAIESLLATVSRRPVPGIPDAAEYRRTEKSELSAALRKLEKRRDAVGR